MKYEVGDRVKIKSLDWYNENKDEYGYVRCLNFFFTPEHSKYCGCEFSISHITEFRIPSYIMEGNGHEWTDEMIECKVEEEVGLVDKFSSRWVNEFSLPDGYIFKDENGNVINATKIVLEKKKKEYPKTYEECCKVLGLLNIDLCFNADYRSFDASKEQRKKLGLMNQFYQLIVCRDAYWKIAGDEMGLGKPWEPDWNNILDKYCIYFISGDVRSKECQTRQCSFAFPTPEMRDAFYENFKELIEQCKELL